MENGKGSDGVAAEKFSTAFPTFFTRIFNVVIHTLLRLWGCGWRHTFVLH